MALPKLNTPTYEMVQPSTGETVKFRPFLVKEQKILMIAQETGEGLEMSNAMCELIKSCTFGKISEPEHLPSFDIEYMWNGAENQFLHRISTCVLESMDVTYGGDRYKSYAGIDGDGAPPIETTMSLNFKEIELITRERVHQGF